MIIIDGPDGAGKSTLGRMLVAHKLVDWCWESPKKVFPSEPLLDSTRKYIQDGMFNHRIAVDRLIFSELVYGPVMRGKCVFSPLEAMSMISDLVVSSSIFIFCLPDVNSLIFKKDEDEAVIKMIRIIHEQYLSWSFYLRAMSRQPTRIIRYQWNIPQSFDVLKSTLKRLTV